MGQNPGVGATGVSLTPEAAALSLGTVTLPWCSLHQSDMLSSNSSGCFMIRLGPYGWEKALVTQNQQEQPQCLR